MASMDPDEHTNPADDQLSGRELGFFALEILLVVAGILTIVHFRNTTAAIFAIGSLLVASMVMVTDAHGSSSGSRDASVVPPLPARPYRLGDYRATSDQLFRVERVDQARALVENCGTGELVDIGLEELDALRPIPVAGPK